MNLNYKVNFVCQTNNIAKELTLIFNIFFISVLENLWIYLYQWLSKGNKNKIVCHTEVQKVLKIKHRKIH